MSRERKGWSDKTLENVRWFHALAGSGRSGILAKYPAVTAEIVKTFRDLRTSGIVVNVPLGRSIMLTIIEEMAPQVLNDKFRCSEAFVRTFFESVMVWSPRKATRAAAHIPPDAPELCERTFFRLVYAMKWEDIPGKLVVNVDQMGNYVLPNSAHTFHDKGATQVDTVGKDEKRAYTLLVASTPSGVLLPFQQVWPGKTPQSLPLAQASGMDEALDRGFHFAVAASESSPRSHFSTLKTMKEWVEEIFLPYVEGVIEADPNLDKNQKAILFIDAYPVHTGRDFREYMRRHENVIVIYVPANCTGIFQPADVGLQRPIKHFLKQELFSFLAQTHRTQMSSGISAENVRITTSFPKLRDASVAPLVRAYDFMTGPYGRELVLKVCLHPKTLLRNDGYLL